jgi:hypothetical protein
MSERTDGEFLEAFESGALPSREFHHRDHLRVTWLYVASFPLDVAVARVLDTLQGFAAAQGATQIFHVTLTCVWVRLVAAAQAGAPAGEGFPAFLARNPHLFDKGLPGRHYRAETLASAEARRGFVPPDLEPLPALSPFGTLGREEGERGEAET